MTLKNLWGALLVLCCLSFAMGDYSGFRQLAAKYSLRWEIRGDIISFNITALSGNCWVGLGIHSEDSDEDCMPLTDVVVASFKNGKIEVFDYFIDDFITPTLDTDESPPGENNILEYSGYSTPNMTVVNFSRKLLSTDQWDHNITNAPRKVIFGIGLNSDIQAAGHSHDGSSHGQTVFNFFDDPPATTATSDSGSAASTAGSATTGTTGSSTSTGEATTTGTTDSSASTSASTSASASSSGSATTTAAANTASSSTTGHQDDKAKGEEDFPYTLVAYVISGAIGVAIIANVVGFVMAKLNNSKNSKRSKKSYSYSILTQDPEQDEVINN